MEQKKKTTNSLKDYKNIDEYLFRLREEKLPIPKVVEEKIQEAYEKVGMKKK